jgi:hypothetical protein
MQKGAVMRRSMFMCGLFLLIVPQLLAQQTGEKPAATDSPATSSENPSVATQYLRSFQTIHVATGTWLAKPEMCEGAIQKHREFEAWDLSFVRASGADVVLKIDHQPGWFYYQYSMVHTASQIVLASGNVTAWDGKAACGRVADIIVARIKKARTQKEKTEPKEQKSKKGKENESS